MFRVIWRQAVQDDLARVYVGVAEAGGDAAAVARASDRVDRLLRTDPVGLGESRAGYERVLIADPLAVTFEVFEDERVVFVVRMVYHPPR